MKKTLAVLAVAVALPALALAQKPVTKTESIEVTGTIEAIDHTAREITVKDATGVMDTYSVGPEVKKFDALKVGDKITARYYAAMAFQVRKPGAAAPAPASDDVKLVPGKGPKPGGTMAQQKQATVTVKAVDAKAPSITVVTDDHRTLTFKVEDPKNLKGVQPGDKIDVTYTEAFMITVQ
jgi:Cu/Ag efflux protein CusF